MVQEHQGRAVSADSSTVGGSGKDHLARSDRRGLLVLFLVLLGGLIAFAVSPGADDYPATVGALLSFCLAPASLRRARPNIRPPLNPLNWVLAVFFLQLVVVPLLICYLGPFPWVLPSMPTVADINKAMALQSMAFLFFCVGVHLWSGRASARTVRRGNPGWRSPSPALLLVYLLAGIVGLGLTFGSISGLTTYFTQPASRFDFQYEATAGLAGVLALLLRPFLGIAAVAVWCRMVDRGVLRTPWRRAVSILLLLALVFGVYGTYSYNRGAFAAPIVAVTAVYVTRVRRVSVPRLIALALLAFVALTFLQTYRNTAVSRAVPSAPRITLNQELQVYASGPQFLGYLIDRSEGRPLSWGQGLAKSVLSPIPTLGRPFRAESDTAVYNFMIYGTTARDQVVPFHGELLLNFGVIGIPLGFVVLGCVMAELRERFRRSRASLEVFVWQYTAVWAAFLVVGSVEVVSQIFIYFFWPIYFLAADQALRRGRQYFAS
jgi:uncharacterized membrane protein YsdA (DUF1294 family)